MNYSVVSEKTFNIHYFNPNAKIVIIGISPGSNQNKAYEKENDVKENNKNCAFAGIMRDNLTKMLNEIKINKYLRIEDCATLWSKDFELANHTSILPQPVVQYDEEIPSELICQKQIDNYKKKFKEHKPNSSFFISGITYKKIKNNKVLHDNFLKFAEDFKKYKDDTLFIVLGKAVNVIEEAIKDNALENRLERIINIPHASAANSGPISAFINKPHLNNDAQTQVKNGLKLRQLADEKIKTLL